MSVHPQFAADFRDDFAVLSDHECDALGWQQADGPCDTEHLGDGLVGITEQRVVKAVLVTELLLLRHVIDADADALCANSREL